MWIFKLRPKIVFFAFAFVLLTCNTGYARESGIRIADMYDSEIDIQKGELWWGLFADQEVEMPFSRPFDFLRSDDVRTIPMLVSSRGRYIWSSEPFAVEFTGDKFRISSTREEVKVQIGGRNLREAYLMCVHKNFPPEGKIPARELFGAPVYDLSQVAGHGASESFLRQCASRILDAGLPAGTLVIPAGWQASSGGFEPDRNLYSDFAGLISELHDRGFHIMLSVKPFVNTEGSHYRDLRSGGGILLDEWGRPEMVEWEGGYSAFYDLTNPGIADQLRLKLSALRDRYGVDGFLFDCKDVLAALGEPLKGDYLDAWTKLGGEHSFSEFTVSADTRAGTYIRSAGKGMDFDGKFLENSLGGILISGLAGYYNTTINAAGTGMSENVTDKMKLRYLQLAAVMPVMNFYFPLWESGDQRNKAAVKELADVRRRFAEYYGELLAESAKTAEPMVRHMEYSFPRNGFSDCDDQFMVGSRYLVAPLLSESDTRTVRFPKGNWIDSQGNKYKGPVVKSITAPEGKILFFESVK